MEVVKKEAHSYPHDNGRKLLTATHASHALTLPIAPQNGVIGN